MIKKNYSRLLGPIIFIVIIYWYVDTDQLIEMFSDLNWFYVLMSLSMAPPLLLIRSARWRRILLSLEIDYPLWRCFKIYCVEMVAVMVVSAIGTFIKALYLQQDSHGRVKPYLSVLADKYYDYYLPLIFGVSSAVIVLMRIDLDLSLIFLFSITFLLYVPARMTVLIFSERVFPKRLKKIFADKNWKVSSQVNQMYTCLDMTTYLFSVGGYLIYFIMIYFLNLSLSLNLLFSQVVLIMTITSLVTMIPISFLGIGTRDIGLIAIFNWFGYLPEQAIALSVSLLLMRIVFILVGSLFWFIYPPPLHLLNPFDKS